MSSTVDTIKHLLGKISQSSLNSYIWTDAERTLAMARASEEYTAARSPRALEGMSIGIKDLFSMKGTPTSACSKILRDYVAPYESTVTERLWNAGAIFMGKQNCDEFGMGSANIHSSYGPALNPHSRNGQPTSPGGSSGGGAASVAAGLNDVSIGTDTGGSSRQPAAWTGIVGFKPTYGLVSRHGVIAHASSLDCPGIMARDVLTVARVLQTIAGYDPKDAQTYDMPVPDFIGACSANLPLKIASYNPSPETLKLPFAESHKVDIGYILEHCVDTYMDISTGEAMSNLARYNGIRYGAKINNYTNFAEYCQRTRSENFGSEVKRRILMGTYVLSNNGLLYKRASQVRQWIAHQMQQQVWNHYDVLVMPTATIGAMTLDEVQHAHCEDIYQSDQCTVMPSLIGGVAMSIPGGLDTDGMPMGIQIIGPPFAEAKVLQVAAHLERSLDRMSVIKQIKS